MMNTILFGVAVVLLVMYIVRRRGRMSSDD